MSSFDKSYYVGIDVGTGSARAILLDQSGDIIAGHTEPTQTWRSQTNASIFEQSTGDIWSKISLCVQTVLSQVASGSRGSEAGSPGIAIRPEQIKGIGFDATCSLAVTDLEGQAISVAVSDNLAGVGIGDLGDRNIILWADHRAEEEAGLINSTGSEVLDFVGGTMSLEMEIPKILWLKRHMPKDKFARCQFFDLPDYLTYKATGSTNRSNCSLVCKTSFIPQGVTKTSDGFDANFLKQIGLDEFSEDASRIGGRNRGRDREDQGVVLTAGMPVGRGLTREAAVDLGLREGTPVGSGVIDAYAGWIGTVAARYQSSSSDTIISPYPSISESTKRLAVVAGTSTCHLAQSKRGVFVPGVWGPYKNALFPEWWMSEGGQSATGQLIDFVITTHPAYSKLKDVARERETDIHHVLADTLEDLRKKASIAAGIEESLTGLTKDIHMYPDFHGNRSPVADAKMRGAISGLSLDDSLSDLAIKFNITLEAIALQTRHIIDEMNAKGHEIDSIYMSGGQAKNIFLMQLFATVCNIPVILPRSHSAAVVVGAAMLGRYAAEVYYRHPNGALTQDTVNEIGIGEKERLWEIMAEMTKSGTRIEPAANVRDKRLLDAKYKIFRETIEIQKRWRKEMEDASNVGN